MARIPRVVSGTGIYHVMMRGINRQDIFEDTDDYNRFMAILQQMVKPIDENGQPQPASRKLSTAMNGAVGMNSNSLPVTHRRYAT